MKTRETKKQNRSSVILSEATDGVNKVRLMGLARAEEEEACPWEEIDDYSGRFVVAGYSTSDRYHPWLAYSTDGGKTWTRSETTAEENQAHGVLRALAYGGGRFVVAGYRYVGTNTDGNDTSSDNYHPWIAYSTDGGKTWEPSTTTSEESQPHGELWALAYGGGRFVVAGWRHEPSTGDTSTGDTSDNYHPWLADSTDGGETWKPSTTTSDNYHPWLAYSTDGGETWTPSTTTSEESQPHGRPYALAYGGGRFVVAGYSTSDNYHPWIAYSTDGGETWKPSTTTSEEDQPHRELRALAYGGGRFVVAGFRYNPNTDGDTSENNHPWIAYSTDGGETWKTSTTTSEEDQPHGRLYALTYGGGRFVVAGYRFGSAGDNDDRYRPWIAYSTDGGETWTKNETTSEKSQPHGRLFALTYGGGRFVVAGFRYDDDDNSESENYHPWLAYSTDGGKTWIRSETTADSDQEHGEPRALTYAPDSYCWKFGKENDKEDEEESE